MVKLTKADKIKRVVADLKAKGAKVRKVKRGELTIIQARFPSGKRWDVVKIV